MVARFHRPDGIELSGGHVEVRAQPVFQATHHLPFVFEGLRVLDLEFEGEKGDHISRQLSAVSHQLNQSTGSHRFRLDLSI